MRGERGRPRPEVFEAFGRLIESTPAGLVVAEKERDRRRATQRPGGLMPLVQLQRARLCLGPVAVQTGQRKLAS